MSFYWSFWTSGTSFVARLYCWPVVPGSVEIKSDDGIIQKVLTDNGDGTFSGDGTGAIDYSTGIVSCDFTTPLPVSGTPVLADYRPVEGGCYDDCGGCATHYLELDITPAAISGQSDLTLSDAWKRLFEKINRDIKPIHVEFYTEAFEEVFDVDISHRYDRVEADVESLDTSGLRVVFDDTSW